MAWTRFRKSIAPRLWEFNNHTVALVGYDQAHADSKPTCSDPQGNSLTRCVCPSTQQRENPEPPSHYARALSNAKRQLELTKSCSQRLSELTIDAYRTIPLRQVTAAITSLAGAKRSGRHQARRFGQQYGHSVCMDCCRQGQGGEASRDPTRAARSARPRSTPTALWRQVSPSRLDQIDRLGEESRFVSGRGRTRDLVAQEKGERKGGTWPQTTQSPRATPTALGQGHAQRPRASLSRPTSSDPMDVDEGSTGE